MASAARRLAPPSSGDPEGARKATVALGGASASSALSALAAVSAVKASAEARAQPSWGRVLRVATARASLTIIVSLVFWSLLPLLAGWTPRVIMSGSMEPRVHVGDIVVTRPIAVQSLTEGKVVTVQDPDHPGRTRTHRILRREADGMLVLKGDANRQADSTAVSVEDVRGIGVLRVPFVGRPAYWVAQRNWLPVGTAILFLGWCVITVLPSSRRSERGPDDDTDHPEPGSNTPRNPRRTRRIAATTAVAAFAIGAAAGPASAAFKQSAANPVSMLSAAATFNTYKAEVLGDGPSFFWRLDETSGTAIADASGNGRPGTLLGQYTQGRAGVVNDSAGTAIGVTTGTITANSEVTGPSSFSVEAWVKSTSTQGGRILGFGDGSGQGASSTVDRQLYLASDGKVYFGIGAAQKAVNSSSAINDGEWHHVVGTYASGNGGMILYVDGVLQDTGKAMPKLSTGYWRAGSEDLSGWEGNPGRYLNGTLDELAVYPRVLTATEISSHYSNATS